MARSVCCVWLCVRREGGVTCLNVPSAATRVCAAFASFSCTAQHTGSLSVLYDCSHAGLACVSRHACCSLCMLRMTWSQPLVCVPTYLSTVRPV